MTKIKNICNICKGVFWNTYSRFIKPYDLRVVQNIYTGNIEPIHGCALLMYITHPFFMKEDNPSFRAHPNNRRSINIVKALNELGYSVDVVHYKNKIFDTKKKYDIVIGIGESFDYGKDYFTESKIKIYLATGLHWLTETYLIYERLLNLKNRKKVTLVPYRVNEPYFSPEKSDIIFSVQNNYSNATYAHLNKPIYSLPQSATLDFPVDYSYTKKVNTHNFLWLSGGGMILKGLDIVLEAFAQMPEYNLKVCAAVSNEPDFKTLYYNELYNLNNIKLYEFVDVGSDEFINIVSDCIAVIYPYPEGELSGSLTTCMYYGLIPILSHFSNNEIKDCAQFVHSSVEGVKNAITKVGNLSNDVIEQKSFKVLKYVENHYDPSNEYESWKLAFQEVLQIWNSKYIP